MQWTPTRVFDRTVGEPRYSMSHLNAYYQGYISKIGRFFKNLKAIKSASVMQLKIMKCCLAYTSLFQNKFNLQKVVAICC